MTASAPTRFIVRRDPQRRRTWMVWDRELRGPVKLDHGLAIRLSEEGARQLRKELELRLKAKK
jgi:hypothetical protein